LPKKFCLFFVLFSMVILFLPFNTFARKLTVDQDGQGNYTSITDAVNAATTNDTIYIQGNDIDFYNDSFPTGNFIDNLTIMGASSNPDSFPIVRITGSNWSNYWVNGNPGTNRIERIVLYDCDTIKLTNNARGLIMDKCIIRNTDNIVFMMSGDHPSSNYLIITNSIFWGNTGTIFSQPNSHNSPGPYGTVTNCTFYGNSTINGDNSISSTDGNKTVIIKNSIFWNNTTIVAKDIIKPYYTYNLLPAGQSEWGTGCISTDDPGFIKSSPDKATDFGLLISSEAIDNANNTGAPSVDITGTSRSGTYDIGAFEYGSVAAGIDLFWDVSISAGYQAGNGTWGENDYWTSDGTTLDSWPGAGNSATFAGSDGEWTITVNGTQNVDSMAFLNDGYTITNGTLNFGTKSGIFVEAGKAAIISATITGTPGLSKYGTGTLILGGSNTFTGPVTINAGVISINTLNNGGSSSNIGASSSSASNLVFNGGTLRYTGEMQSCNRLFTLSTNGGTIDGSGTGALNFNNSGSMGLSGSGARTLTLTGSATGNILAMAVGDNGGATSITKSGSGSWILTGDNTASGTVNITDGTLQIGNGGTSGSINGPVTNNGTLIFNKSNSYTFTKVISGTGNLIKTGGGTLSLSGANTYSGSTSINYGTLQLDAANVIPNGASKGDVLLYGTLNLNGYSDTINGLSGNGIVNNTSIYGTPVLTIGANNANSTFEGSINNNTGALQLTKTGSGTIILTGNNTYSGATTVSAGELRINGSASSSALTVNSGAKLSGTGTVGQVTINNGGEISPGSNSVGTLTTGSLILNNSSVLNFELGTSSDQIIVNGNLTLNGILNITNSGGFDAGDYTLITYTGTLTDNTVDIGTVPMSSYQYSIQAGSGKVILHVTSKEELLPLTVVEDAPVCSVYTEKWTLVFDNNNGGGINVLTDSIHGLDHGQGNQIGALQNLFFLEYSGTSSKQNGSWSVKQIGTCWAIINQSGTLGGGISYNNDYTVHGSGKIFIKSTISNSGSDVSGKTVRLGCERKPVATMAIFTGSTTAGQSPYVLLSSDASKHNDILLCISELWTTSAGIPNSATGFYNSAASGYAGYECSNFSLESGQKQSWEFMIDFSHHIWNDTSGVGSYADDYRNPDSLVYLIGTPAMERDWEQYLYGHWKLDETGTTTVAGDASGNNRHGTVNGGSWTGGRLVGAIQLNGSQYISVPDNADFKGNYNFTVMAWIKPSATISSSSIIIGKHNGTQGWKFTGGTLGRLGLTLNGTSFSGTTTALGTGTWHHVAVSWNTAGKVTFYVNGNVDRVSSGSYTVTNNNENVIIGSGFNGIIDDVRCYGTEVPENTIKSIYRNGYRSSEGVYDTRASNENTLNVLIDGDNVPRRFPVFRIANYWATSKPAPGCVRLNGSILEEGVDYFADLNDAWNLLYIGLNKVIMSNSENLFIDDANSHGALRRKTPIIVSGKQSNGSVDYFWVKNFTENSFDSSTSRQWYINWKMSENYAKDGDPWFMGASVTNPYTLVDTNNLTNLIPGYDGYNDSWGTYTFKIGQYYPKTSWNVWYPFTYTVEESSSVRVILRINERWVINNTSYFTIVTRWTMYPTGQFFKWDSIYNFSAAPSHVYNSASFDDTTFSTFYLNKRRKRGGIIYSSKYPDLTYAWLSMKNSSGYQPQPFDSDTILTWRESNRVALDFGDSSASNLWNSSTIQTVVYLDMQHPNMNSAFVDSAANSVQYPLTPAMITGSLLSGASATQGDLNGDGFNEREGAYILEASNNEIHFRLPARGDTCRFKPAFRITNYTAISKPQYVIIYRGADTLALIEGFYYNAYLNRTSKELVIQIDSVFCDTVSIFISSDRTLAVTLSRFSASAGDRCDTLFWRTESEQENLGFYLLRRVNPVFLDSLMKAKSKKNAADIRDTLLLKNKAVAYNDTEWVRVNEQIIPGAKSGASFGPREYMYIDYMVQNDILYEYKLVSVDYANKEKNYGPVQAMPRRLLPPKFTLYRNFPNPFKASTIIRFALPQDSRISLNIYNLQGKLVKRLVKPDKVFLSGNYQVTWDGKGEGGAALAAGPYVYRLVSGNFAEAHIMLLAR